MEKQEYDAYFPTTGETRRVKFNPAHIRQAAIVILGSRDENTVFIQKAGRNETLLICVFVPSGNYVPGCNNDGHFHFFTEEEVI